MRELRERFVAMVVNDPGLYGLSEARFVHAPQVFTMRGVRLRCQYACSMTRQSDFSPPHSPTSDETRAVLEEYRYGLLLRREEPGRHGMDPGALYGPFADRVLAIEAECWTRGYPRAFVPAIGTCLYQHHDDSLRPCEYASKCRPTLEAIGVELRDTFEMVQWQQYLSREPDGPMQLFALLLLE